MEMKAQGWWRDTFRLVRWMLVLSLALLPVVWLFNLTDRGLVIAIELIGLGWLLGSAGRR